MRIALFPISASLYIAKVAILMSSQQGSFGWIRGSNISLFLFTGIYNHRVKGMCVLWTCPECRMCCSSTCVVLCSKGDCVCVRVCCHDMLLFSKAEKSRQSQQKVGGGRGGKVLIFWWWRKKGVCYCWLSYCLQGRWPCHRYPPSQKETWGVESNLCFQVHPCVNSSYISVACEPTGS